MATTKPVVRYEDNAEQRTVTGWCCKSCGRYWGDDQHMARYCCATEMECKGEGCTNRIPSRSLTHCDSCRARRDRERFEKLEKVEWDGETPLCVFDDDKFFWDEDSVIEYVADRLADGADVEDVWLVLAKPGHTPCFEMAEFLTDDLPEDYDDLGFAEIDKIVNDWLKARSPFAWWASNKALSVESVKAIADSIEREGDSAG